MNTLLGKKQLYALILLAILSVALFFSLILVKQSQEVRKKAGGSGANNVVLSLYPTNETLKIGESKVFELKALFTDGIPNEKLDYFKTEITFDKNYIRIPADRYIDTSMSGFTKILRVDGPTAANENGKIIIELRVNTPGSGPATDKAITIAKIYFEGVTKTTNTQSVTIGAPEFVNNSSTNISASVQNLAYTVEGIEGITRASLSCTPSTGTYNIGDTITADLHLDTRGFSVFGSDIYLTYDPTILEALGSKLIPLTDSTNWTGPISNIVDPTSGKIHLDYDNNQEAYTGSTSAAQISFKAIREGTAQLPYIFFQQYDDTTAGVTKVWGKKDGINLTNILTDVNNCIYVIKSEKDCAMPFDECPPPPQGCVYEGGDGCQSCGQLNCGDQLPPQPQGPFCPQTIINQQIVGCPQWAPPPPDWCLDGTVVNPGNDENGCRLPPVCERPSCCEELKNTGDPSVCSWPDRGYCRTDQCSSIKDGVNEQRCGWLTSNKPD